MTQIVNKCIDLGERHCIHSFRRRAWCHRAFIAIETTIGTQLEQFVEKVMALQAQRRAPSLPENETELLQQINHGMPADMRQRYDALNAKLHDETITPEEHEELLTLIDRLELADAERMQRLVALAQIRGVSVDTLMEQLGIRRTTYA